MDMQWAPPVYTHCSPVKSKGGSQKVQQAVFVGGTCGSIHVESFNMNFKAWGVLESKWDPIRKKLRETPMS